MVALRHIHAIVPRSTCLGVYFCFPPHRHFGVKKQHVLSDHSRKMHDEYPAGVRTHAAKADAGGARRALALWHSVLCWTGSLGHSWAMAPEAMFAALKVLLVAGA